MLLYLFLTLTNHLDHSQEQNFLDSCLLSVGELKKWVAGQDCGFKNETERHTF